MCVFMCLCVHIQMYACRYIFACVYNNFSYILLHFDINIILEFFALVYDAVEKTSQSSFVALQQMP